MIIILRGQLIVQRKTISNLWKKIQTQNNFTTIHARQIT